jgi:hypothetical protein
MTFSTRVFRPFGRRKLTDTSFNTLLDYASSIEVLDFVPTARNTPSTLTVAQPYTDSRYLWGNYFPNDDVEAAYVPAASSSPLALSDAFHSTPLLTQAQPYEHSGTTPALRSSGDERFYGTFHSQSSGRSLQSQRPARESSSDPNKKPLRAAVLALCILTGTILASTYFGYMGITALCRWIRSEIQGTWVENLVAWVAQRISWFAKAVVHSAKVIVNWIWQRI